MECGAKKRDGTPCRAPAMANGRCRIHGGKSLSGTQSGTFKTGRYSKHLPSKLAALYADTAHDPELLSVRQDIRLLDALLLSNFANLESGESGKHWDDILKWIGKAQVAYKSENYGALEHALAEMEAITDGRRLHYATEAEIRDKLEQRRKLVETEQKITLQGERAISAEQLMLLMTSVLQVITSVVQDSGQRYAIANELDKLISRQPSLVTSGGGTAE